MDNRINYQEDYSRKNNIRINGVEERGGGGGDMGVDSDDGVFPAGGQVATV